ncbi:MAG: bifunctional hydroxymethylpyrimidine kinase/phosphomethylpyrimidine kinase [candidate division KSB1 bacterium]|nr:bifunctional hydroxymethylpyrimidine kinase/phosphomethylpyrimidine kinase [candidate division KSB1 bacterium]
MIHKAMTIAGSDSGGGAGIQADLKTFTAFGVYGTSALTALTAQNTTGVQGIFEIPPDFIREQIASVMTDIGTDAAKTGMLANDAIVDVVAEAIETHNIPNVVVDPVMIAKGGDPLLSESARIRIKTRLIPLATVVTPNVFEAETLLDMKIDSLEDMKKAARELRENGCPWIVIKGGHLRNGKEAIDVVYDGTEYHLLKSERYQTENTHGTGCTFSSAIAAGLAKGYDVLKSIETAKAYISAAIRESLAIGSGHGPTNHLVGTTTEW